MTRDYSEGKIYKIECLTTGKVYVGHTTYEHLSQRLAKHKNGYKRWKEGLSQYITAYDIIELNNYEMTLLESYPCKSKDELEARERFWIQSMDVVNRFIPTRTKSEWYQDNRERLVEKNRHKREQNREQIYEQQRRYKAIHKDILTLKNKEYYDRHKESILAKQAQKFTCECGSTLRVAGKSTHFKSQKHQQFINKDT